jgi:hypothetical protein
MPVTPMCSAKAIARSTYLKYYFYHGYETLRFAGLFPIVY